MAILGYLRVTEDRGLDGARAGKIAAYAESRGLDPVEFVESDRRGGWKPIRLDWLIEEKCRPGDSLIVPDFTTIARSMQDIHRILSAMKGRRTSLHIVDRGIIVDPEDESPPAVLNAGTAALFADFEREVITVSLRESLKTRLEKGRKWHGQSPAQ